MKVAIHLFPDESVAAAVLLKELKQVPHRTEVGKVFPKSLQ